MFRALTSFLLQSYPTTVISYQHKDTHISAFRLNSDSTFDASLKYNYNNLFAPEWKNLVFRVLFPLRDWHIQIKIALEPN